MNLAFKSFLILVFLIFSNFVFSQENSKNHTEDETLTIDEKSSQKKSNWTFSLVTDFAYYFKTDPVSGGNHFAPLTGIYGGVEPRTTFNANYKIITPLGKNFLVKNSNLKLCTSFELSPITIKPAASVVFEPVPFLIFSTGAGIGTGWSLLGLPGLNVINYENSKFKYEDLTPFEHWFYEYWAKGLFQFDTGVLIPGNWTHVLLQASIMFRYIGVTGIDSNKLWVWQNSINYCTGWKYESNIVLGYQLPFMLNMIGVMTDIIGQVNNKDFGIVDENYNGSFVEVNISPLIKLKFTEKNSMFILARFKSRRSFYQEYESKYDQLPLDYAGREWLFDRIAFSWTHLF